MQNAEPIPSNVKILHPQMSLKCKFSICTLVTRPDQYRNMLDSYHKAGFCDDCEFICIDNSSGNVYDAFQGYNAFLVEASGKYIILTHQDVELCFDDRKVLEDRLDQLDVMDPDWGACGNAGGIDIGKIAIRISDPHGDNKSSGSFPARVFSLDENFIVTRRDANLSLSRDLSGYHMYGSDICVMADLKGHTCYVIDFHIRHLSAGNIDTSFRDSEKAFAEKYNRAFRPRWIQTTVTAVLLSANSFRKSFVKIKHKRVFRMLKIFG